MLQYMAGLIDLVMVKQDSSIGSATVNEGEFPDRTGTMLYMAISLDIKFRFKRHLIWLDLDSAFCGSYYFVP